MLKCLNLEDSWESIDRNTKIPSCKGLQPVKLNASAVVAGWCGLENSTDAAAVKWYFWVNLFLILTMDFLTLLQA